MSEKTFANGIIFKEPSSKAPDFVVGSLSVKKSEFIPFLNSQIGDWVNLQIKLSKAGKPYIELDTWKPNKEETKEPKEPRVDSPYIAPEDSSSELPF